MSEPGSDLRGGALLPARQGDGDAAAAYAKALRERARSGRRPRVVIGCRSRYSPARSKNQTIAIGVSRETVSVRVAEIAFQACSFNHSDISITSIEPCELL